MNNTTLLKITNSGRKLLDKQAFVGSQITQRAGEMGDRGRTHQIGGGGFNKQENLQVLSCISTPAHLNLNVYIEALTGFSHVSVPMVQTTPYSLKIVSLKQLWLPELWPEHTFQAQRSQCGSSHIPNAWVLSQWALLSSRWPSPTKWFIYIIVWLMHYSELGVTGTRALEWWGACSWIQGPEVLT